MKNRRQIKIYAWKAIQLWVAMPSGQKQQRTMVYKSPKT